MQKEHYMRLALEEAAAAAAEGEVPVGAVIVQRTADGDSRIVARAHNMVEQLKSSSAHAELIAVSRAEKLLEAKWLLNCDMYVTLEPCSMCAGAMVLARIENLVFGASDPKNGACGSTLNVACCEGLNHRLNVCSGVLEAECGGILTEFFREKRRKAQITKRPDKNTEN